jgi:spore maturation protein CgeB
MNISFFGSSLLSAYWNGAATYYRGMIRALHDRGHRITFYEPDAFDRQSHRDLDPPSWARVVVYPPSEKALAACLDEARNADLVIKASGVGLFDTLLEEAVPHLKSDRTLTAFWDVDAPATLARVLQDVQDPFRAQIPRYDFIFTYGGGPRVIHEYGMLGARECLPIYNALDPESHFPVPASPRFAADLAFLGNRLPDREERVRTFFLEPARHAPELRFLLGGNGWQDLPLPPNVRYAGHVYTAEHNLFNCSATLVLNVCRASMADYGFSPATRVFEAAGAAACVVTDWWEGIDHFFEPGSEILVAHTGLEVAEIARTTSAATARKIGEAARRRALAHHTYAERAREFEEAVEGCTVL